MATTKDILSVLFADKWHDDVVDRVIEKSTEPLSARQKSELAYFMNEVARHLDGREDEALAYLESYWCFYSEANPAWLAIAERELQAYCADDGSLPEHRLRSFNALRECLQRKTIESSELAFKMLEFDEESGQMRRI